MSPAELLVFLQDFFRDTLHLFHARQTIAQSVSAYDANNAYQQVLGRQEVHLQWLADAIAALGGTPADAHGVRRETATGGRDGAKGQDVSKGQIDADVRDQKAFIDRWTPRLDTVTNARNRKMLELVIGEMKEHLRVLQQAAEGRTDLLGRHSDGKVLRGQVMAARPKN